MLRKIGMHFEGWSGLGILIIVLCFVMGSIEMAGAQPQVVKLSYLQNDGEHEDVIAKRAKEYIEKQSQGRYKVELYCCAKLGSEEAMFTSTKTGVTQMSLLSCPGYSDPMINISCSPFVIQDLNHFYKVWEGPVGAEIANQFEKRTGVKPVHFYYRIHQYIFSTKPIIKPEDWKKYKIRTATMIGCTSQVKGIGGNVVPLPFTEVYMALKTGVIDGVQTVLDAFVGFKFYEVCKYAIDIKHDFSPWIAFINSQFLQSLPAKDQEIYVNAFKHQKEENEKWVDGKIQYYNNRLKEEGVRLYGAPDGDVALYRQMLDKFIRENSALFGGEEIYNKIVKLK